MLGALKCTNFLKQKMHQKLILDNIVSYHNRQEKGKTKKKTKFDRVQKGYPHISFIISTGPRSRSKSPYPGIRLGSGNPG